jgi:hypothetical protein
MEVSTMVHVARIGVYYGVVSCRIQLLGKDLS